MARLKPGRSTPPSPHPSVMSFSTRTRMPFSMNAPLEERRARAVQLRRTLPSDARDIGALDAAAIAEVAGESWPVVRSADELHDALLALSIVPPVSDWHTWYDELAQALRVTTLVVADQRFWVATERRRLAQALYPGGRFTQQVPDIEQYVPEGQEAAAADVLRGWLESTGPQTSTGLAGRLAIPSPLVDSALARLEGEGQILRGRFSPGNGSVDGDVEWCNRRVLARVHRKTLGRLRREIEPVSAADFVRFLSRWQHLAPGTQLHATAGLLQILRQLQGYEIGRGGVGARCARAPRRGLHPGDA